MSELANKSIAIVGLGRSGMAAANVLSKLGTHVQLYDSKPTYEMPKVVEAAAELGLTVHGGGEPVDPKRLDYVVVSPGVRTSSDQLAAAKSAGVPIIGEIEAAYRIAKAPIVAVTGTNGKTTTTVLVGEMLRAAGRRAYVGGNIAAGEIALPLIQAAYEAGPTDAIVAEISSFQLETIDRFKPSVAAILNITPDHADRQSWDEYVAAKWRIFQNQTPDDTSVLSDSLADSPQAHSLKSRVVRFGPAETASIVEQVVPLSDVLLPGVHNMENIAAAIVMARACGVDVAAMRQVIRTFGGVVHRLEFVRETAGVRYINNSMCTNVDAFAKSLAAVPEPKVVIMGGVFKGDDPSPLADAVMANNVRTVVLIGRSAPEIDTALKVAGYRSVEMAGSLAEAVEAARKSAKTGDTVMLAPACASFDMFRDFEDRGDQFKTLVLG